MNHLKQKTTPLSRRLALPLLTALITLAACSSQDASIAEKIKLQTATNPTAPLDLKKVGPAEWDRVCIFTPYSTTDHIEKHLGFKWNASIHSTISENDGVHLVVFANRKNVVAFADIPRSYGDFQRAADNGTPCTTPTNALLSRSSRSDSTPLFSAPQ